MSIDLDAVRLKWIFAQLAKTGKNRKASLDLIEVSKLYVWDDIYDWRNSVDLMMLRGAT